MMKLRLLLETAGFFWENVNKIAAHPDRVESLKCDSFNIKKMKNISHDYSLISIDGGHTKEHTFNDLSYAGQSVTPGGLIVLDDFMNPSWLGVVEGAVNYLNQLDRRIVPIFCGYNKLFFTTFSEAKIVKENMEVHLSADPSIEIATNTTLADYKVRVLK